MLSPLIKTAKGLRINWKEKSKTLHNPEKFVREMMAQFGFLVLEEVGSLEEAQFILGFLGDLVNHEKRKEGVLVLDGAMSETEVLRGKESMPLHKDGLLMGLDVKFVALYCLELQDMINGRTFISDMAMAMPKIPEEDLNELKTHGLEVQSMDTDYYFAEGGKWHQIPSIKKYGDEELLNIGLPYKKDQMASWLSRVPQVEEQRSSEILQNLEDLLMHEDFIYYHDWTLQDMLLIDNRRLLHGRESFAGIRTLANIQVIES